MPRTKKTEEQEKTKKEEKTKEIKEASENDSPVKVSKISTAKKETKKDKEDKLAKLKEKAKAFEESLEEKEADIRKKLKLEEEKETLVPIEHYLKSSIHLGTRAITPDMRPYVYKRRADSLAVFNTTLLDEKIREGAEYLSKYAPEDIVIVCKREAGAKPVALFSRVTGIRVFVKKYPAGILTNPKLDTFIETELLLICDPWTDRSALDDAVKIKIPVMAICDTNNYTMHIDKIIPGNNKSAKSLGIIFYLLAKIYVEKRNLKTEVPDISEWIESWDSLVPPK